jgi:hypothetical protein
MKRILGYLAIVVALGWTVPQLRAQDPERDSIMQALKTIDPELVRYFPRWRVCEPNLQLQIRQTFIVNGRDKNKLDMQNIVITAAPKSDPNDYYTILLVECGEEYFVASEVDAYMRKLAGTLSDPMRPYCYREIPAETPPSERQYRVIVDFMMPTDVAHSISISAFEQALKIGGTGFWIRSVLGTDNVGYHFWSAGESRVLLQRPLYENTDPVSSKPIPYLINLRLGGAYRLRGGLDNRLLSFLPARQLNANPGKASLGLDVHAPFHPQFGLSFNVEFPIAGPDTTRRAEKSTWAGYTPSPERQLELRRTAGVDPTTVLPVLRTTGNAALFYNWWLDPKHPENFFRFDLGVCYTEVQEWAYRRTQTGDTAMVRNISGLQLYHPVTAADWVYARLEYRSQSTFPFGVTLQYANQMLFARAYVPLIGEWLYLEGKYATPLRSQPRPWEIKNFFMISPVLRLTIR